MSSTGILSSCKSANTHHHCPTQLFPFSCTGMCFKRDHDKCIFSKLRRNPFKNSSEKGEIVGKCVNIKSKYLLVQWLVLSPYSKVGPGFESESGNFCVEFACSPCVTLNCP